MTIRNKKRIAIIRIFVFIIAIFFIICGAVSGELDTVLRKASSICLECIGIG